MSINITGTLVPASSTFGIANATDLVGGSSQWANEAAISAINVARLVVGEQTYSQARSIVWILQSLTPAGGFVNGTWGVFSAPNAGNFIGAKVVSTSNITLSGSQTIDSVSVGTGDVVLVAGQTDPTQDGPYTVSSSTFWTRAPGATVSGNFVTGKTISIASGTIYAASIWSYTGISSPSLGTDPITFGVNSAGGSTVNLSSPPPIGDVLSNAVYANTLIINQSGAINWAAGTAPVMGNRVAAFTSDADLDLHTIGTTLNGFTVTLFSSGNLTQKRAAICDLTAGTFHVFRNNFPEGFPATIRGQTGTGFDLENGGNCFAWCDGTNWYRLGGEPSSTDPTIRTTAFTMGLTDAGCSTILFSTSGAAFTATLPASPTLGMRRTLKDAGLAIATNGLTVSSGSSAKVQNPGNGSKAATSVVFGVATGSNNGSSATWVFDGTDWVVL